MMKRWFSIPGVGLCCTLLLATSPVDAAPTRIRADQVEVKDCPRLKAFVSVTDGDGKPVLGLASKKFSATVADRAVPEVEAKTFEESGEGMAVVLVLDKSYSMRSKMSTASAIKVVGAPGRPRAAKPKARPAMAVQKESAISFIKGLKPADRVAVVTFGNTVDVVRRMTAPGADIQAQVGQLDHDAAAQHSKLHDGILKALDVAKGESNLPRRRALVVFSDGKDKDSTHTLADCIKKAKEAGIAVHTVGISGLRVKAANLDHLKRLATDTGGTFNEAPDEQTLQELHKDITSQLKDIYVLSFTPPKLSGDGKARDLVVSLEVTQGNTLTATRQFIIPTTQSCPYKQNRKDEPLIVVETKQVWEEAWFMAAVAGGVLVLVVFGLVMVMRSKKKKEEMEREARRCSKCGQIKPPGAITCPTCPKPDKEKPIVPILPPPPEPKAAKVLATLTIIKGGPTGARGHTFDITQRTTKIGREEGTCQILLPDDKASRIHATLFLGDDGFELHDLDSANGTFVNDQNIQDVEPGQTTMKLLNHGDAVRIGRLKMKFLDKR